MVICCDKVCYITVHYSTLQYITLQYSILPYSTLQYNTVQYIKLQYSTVLYSTLQYSIECITAHIHYPSETSLSKHRSPQCETRSSKLSRWRLPGIGAMAVLVKSIQTVSIGPDRVSRVRYSPIYCMRSLTPS